MGRRLISGDGLAVLWGLLFACSAGAEPPQGVRFLATGDVPYFDAALPRYRELLELGTERAPDFLVHVGDIKRSTAPCSDEAFASIGDLFRDQPVPVVYTPGDNEWTDCHLEPAGGYQPRERLRRLRQLFFKDGAVLRLDRLGAEHQKAPFVENIRFIRSDILFVTLHVVGSHNNRQPKRAKAMEEFRERDAANQRFLKESIRQAKARGVKAIVIFFHADPGFDREKPDPGFKATLEGLRALVEQVSVPVLLVHGDSHEKRIDHPLTDRDGKLIERFTRLEVPGAPDVRGILVDVHPDRVPPFSFEEVSPPGGFSWW